MAESIDVDNGEGVVVPSHHEEHQQENHLLETEEKKLSEPGDDDLDPIDENRTSTDGLSSSNPLDTGSFRETVTDDVAMAFPQRLMEILDDEANSEIIAWIPHGRAFVIYRKKEFENTVLPKYFNKASKFTSFTRKLNRWGFVRITRGPETGAYYHHFFKRGEHRLCMQMSCHSSVKKKDEMASIQPQHHYFPPPPTHYPYAVHHASMADPQQHMQHNHMSYMQAQAPPSLQQQQPSQYLMQSYGDMQQPRPPQQQQHMMNNHGYLPKAPHSMGAQPLASMMPNYPMVRQHPDEQPHLLDPQQQTQQPMHNHHHHYQHSQQHHGL